MPQLDDELTARSVRQVRYAALDGAVILWPEAALAPAFSALLARGWLPGSAMRLLATRESAGSESLERLAGLFPIERIELDEVEPAEMCARLGSDTILTATLPPGERAVPPRWVAPLSGWSGSALEALAEAGIPGPPLVDEHELVAVAMQRMRRLGYL